MTWMNWVGIYLMIGFALGLLNVLFGQDAKDAKSRLQEVTREKIEELVKEGRMDKGEYSGNRTVYFPKDFSDILSRVSLEVHQNVSKRNAETIAVWIILTFTFLWFFVIVFGLIGLALGKGIYKIKN